MTNNEKSFSENISTTPCANLRIFFPPLQLGFGQLDTDTCLMHMHTDILVSS